MKLLGFNFTKINAEKKLEFKSTAINTDIEFLEIEKDKIEMLKDSEIIKISFRFAVNYKEEAEKEEKKETKQENSGKISFEGTILFSTDKEESKEILKAWKKKEIPPQFKVSIFNLILNKCSIKALSLEEDLNLPYHVPLPKVQIQPKQ